MGGPGLDPETWEAGLRATGLLRTSRKFHDTCRLNGSNPPRAQIVGFAVQLSSDRVRQLHVESNLARVVLERSVFETLFSSPQDHVTLPKLQGKYVHIFLH